MLNVRSSSLGSVAFIVPMTVSLSLFSAISKDWSRNSGASFSSTSLTLIVNTAGSVSSPSLASTNRRVGLVNSSRSSLSLTRRRSPSILKAKLPSLSGSTLLVMVNVRSSSLGSVAFIISITVPF